MKKMRCNNKTYHSTTKNHKKSRLHLDGRHKARFARLLTRRQAFWRRTGSVVHHWTSSSWIRGRSTGLCDEVISLLMLLLVVHLRAESIRWRVRREGLHWGAKVVGKRRSFHKGAKGELVTVWLSTVRVVRTFCQLRSNLVLIQIQNIETVGRPAIK